MSRSKDEVKGVAKNLIETLMGDLITIKDPSGKKSEEPKPTKMEIKDGMGKVKPVKARWYDRVFDYIRSAVYAIGVLLALIIPTIISIGATIEFGRNLFNNWNLPDRLDLLLKVWILNLVFGIVVLIGVIIVIIILNILNAIARAIDGAIIDRNIHKNIGIIHDNLERMDNESMGEKQSIVQLHRPISNAIDDDLEADLKIPNYEVRSSEDPTESCCDILFKGEVIASLTAYIIARSPDGPYRNLALDCDNPIHEKAIADHLLARGYKTSKF
jgi:hypothetical protein